MGKIFSGALSDANSYLLPLHPTLALIQAIEIPTLRFPQLISMARDCAASTQLNLGPHVVNTAVSKPSHSSTVEQETGLFPPSGFHPAEN